MTFTRTLVRVNILSTPIQKSKHWLLNIWLFVVLHPLGNPAVSSMAWYPTPSHYPDTEPTSPCSILITPGSEATSIDLKVICLTWPGFKSTRLGFPDLPKWETDTLLIRSLCLVVGMASQWYNTMKLSWLHTVSYMSIGMSQFGITVGVIRL